MAAGQDFGLKPGHTSSIRRIEGGMLSYHADIDADTNPYELGLGRLVDLDMDAEFIGKAALKQIFAQGVTRKQVGLHLGGDPLAGPNNDFWPVKIGGKQVGKVTSAIYSSRLNANIALAMVDIKHTDIGSELEVITQKGQRSATVVEKPFYDPKKSLAST
jgi:aminomethyltransferase